MSEKSESPGVMLICNWGLGRSRAGEKAYRSIGVDAGRFIGGTNAMRTMSDEEIKRRIPKGTSVLLIYDQGTKDPGEYEDKELAVERLNNLGIGFRVIDSLKLAIMLYDEGVNIDEFL
jgi:hypothetical protein